jgi:small neutral amino acid transporter SnatA (MarC family)
MMGAGDRPRFGHYEQFPWFVLAAAVVTVVLASLVVLWLTRIAPIVFRLLGSL